MKRGIPKPKTKEPIRETTRLTYAITEGLIESSPILIGSEICIVQIDKGNKVYRIVDVQTKKFCFALGSGRDVEDLKKKARKRLVECSASIYAEIRGDK